MNAFSLRRLLRPRTLAGKAGAAALILASILVILYFAARHYTSKRLAEAWKLGERFGLSNDLHELVGPYAPPHENAATAIDEAALLAGQFFADLRKDLGMGQGDDVFHGPAVLAAMDRLASDSTYETLLSEADRRQTYSTTTEFAEPLVNTVLGHLAMRNKLCDAERLIALRWAEKGRREDAVRRLMRLHRITRKWEGKEPFSLAARINVHIRTGLVEAMNEILRLGGPLAKPVHEEIEAEIACNELVFNSLPWTGWTEVIRQCDLQDHERQGIEPLGAMIAAYGKAKTIENAFRLLMTWDKPHSIARSEQKSLSEQARATGESPIEARLNWRTHDARDSIYSTRILFTRLVAKSRCLRIVNAWSRSSSAGHDLDSTMLPQASLIDPFTDGARLRVKRTADGPIVYTVDKNLRDDDGDIDPRYHDDAGLGPVKKMERP